MGEKFDVEERWPELFEGLAAKDRQGVLNALGSNWQEGWEPNRLDVENLTDYARGAIDEAEYDRRAAEAAERYRSR
ncbi:antitoxin VbhA family protein [Antribacter gilvus]|uniref:antitoxin VbhA family protein n=1 Tax=Antribacter gilvus TaxID=2304675 RepID=UPI000F77E5D8|nr:antitoxin VbhA family protein [Antribacter gilvus]